MEFTIGFTLRNQCAILVIYCYEPSEIITVFVNDALHLVIFFIRRVLAQHLIYLHSCTEPAGLVHIESDQTLLSLFQL